MVRKTIIITILLLISVGLIFMAMDKLDTDNSSLSDGRSYTQVDEENLGDDTIEVSTNTGNSGGLKIEELGEDNMSEKDMDSEKMSDEGMDVKGSVTGNTNDGDLIYNLCYESDVELTLADISGWVEHRNFVAGYELFRPKSMKIAREPFLEEQGLEVFRITSDLVFAKTILSVYDVRKQEYSFVAQDGSRLTYDVENNLWVKSFNGPEKENCILPEAGFTKGAWPIHISASEESSNAKNLKYILVHPQLEDNNERFPVILEFYLSAELSGMDEIGLDNFETFLSELESVIQLVRFFIPQ